MDREQVRAGLRESLSDLSKHLNATDAADLIQRVQGIQSESDEETVSLLGDMVEALSEEPWPQGEYGPTPPETYPLCIIAQEYMAKWRNPSYQTIWEAYGIA